MLIARSLFYGCMLYGILLNQMSLYEGKLKQWLPNCVGPAPVLEKAQTLMEQFCDKYATNEIKEL